jgi:hypothetical protein
VRSDNWKPGANSDVINDLVPPTVASPDEMRTWLLEKPNANSTSINAQTMKSGRRS